MNQLLKQSMEPVDPELFLWCSGVYNAAASLQMPVENPANRPLLENNGQVYSFSDIPMNRGMLAVMKELRERGASEAEKMSLTCRLMHMGDIFKAKKLERFVKPGDEPGSSMVSEALLKACATAKMVVTKDQIRFDMNDLARIADRLTAEEDATG